MGAPYYQPPAQHPFPYHPPPRRESFFTSHLGKYVEDLLTMNHAAEMDERGQRRLDTQQYSQHMRLLHALAFGLPVRPSFHFTTTLHPYFISNLFPATSFSFFASSYHTAIMMKTYSRKHHHQPAPVIARYRAALSCLSPHNHRD